MKVTIDWLVWLVLVVFIGGILYSRIAAKFLEVTMQFSPVAFKKEMVQGELSLLFQKKLLFGKIRIFLQFKNRMTGQCYTMTGKAFVGVGQTERINLRLGMKYSGNMLCTIEKVRVYDWFGITYKTIYPKEKVNVLVMPDYTDSQKEEMIHFQDNFNGMQLIPHKNGYDYSEPAGIREYRQGDSMKSIHWKLTGRMDTLFVKEPSMPVEESVVLFAETIHEKPLSPEECDKLASRLFSICTWLLERHISYKVCWYGTDKEQLAEFLVESEPDLQRVLHKFLGCRQIAGSQSGRNYYEHLQGEKEIYYIA